MPGLSDYLSNYAEDFQRGLGILGQGVKNTVTGQAPLSALRPDVLLAAGMNNAQSAVANSPLGIPKAALRGGVGLDPTGSAITDLQNLGVSAPIAGGVGAGVDFLGDPMLLTGLMRGRAPRAAAQESAAAQRLPRVMAQDKLMGTRPAGNLDPKILEAQQRVLRNPDFVQSMQGVDPGATFQGQGAQAVTFRNPVGDVSRVGFPEGSVRSPTAPPSPIQFPELNTPTYNQVFGNTRVTRTPFAEMGSISNPEANQAASRLSEIISKYGLDPWDVTAPNVGKVNGRWLVTDMDAVARQPGIQPSPQVYIPPGH